MGGVVCGAQAKSWNGWARQHTTCASSVPAVQCSIRLRFPLSPVQPSAYCLCPEYEVLPVVFIINVTIKHLFHTILMRKHLNIFIERSEINKARSVFTSWGWQVFCLLSPLFLHMMRDIKSSWGFFSLVQLPCSLTQLLELCILYCFLRRLLSQLTQTVVAPIRHHSKLITTTMITNQKIDSSDGRIILINLILVERSAVHSPAHQWGPFVPVCPRHLKPVNMTSNQHLGNNKKQIVLSGFIKDHHQYSNLETVNLSQPFTAAFVKFGSAARCKNAAQAFLKQQVGSG